MTSSLGSDRKIKSVSDWYRDYSNAGSWNPQPGVEPPDDQTASTPPVTAAPAPAPTDNTQSTGDTGSTSTPLKNSIDPQEFKNSWTTGGVSSENKINPEEFRGKWGVDAQGFKDKWVSGLTSAFNEGPSSQAQAANNNAAAITAQDMTPTQEQGFDTEKWGYYAGSAPKYEDMDSNVQKRVAGLDYSVQQDRNYWAAKADVTRAGTFGDVWKMPSPTWTRWEDPEEIKPTWQDKKDDDDK